MSIHFEYNSKLIHIVLLNLIASIEWERRGRSGRAVFSERSLYTVERAFSFRESPKEPL